MFYNHYNNKNDTIISKFAKPFNNFGFYENNNQIINNDNDNDDDDNYHRQLLTLHNSRLYNRIIISSYPLYIQK